MKKAWVKSWDSFPVTKSDDFKQRASYKAMSATHPETYERFIGILDNPGLIFRKPIPPEATEGRFAIHHIFIESGADFPVHSHDDLYAIIFITQGKGALLLDGERIPVKVGDYIYLPPGSFHQIVADEPLGYLACVSPDLSQSKDKIDIKFADLPT